VSPLGPPPSELGDFPAHDLDTGQVLYRVHRRGLSPWWFSSDGSGRFDLVDERGTCYVAQRPLGAFIEVFRIETVIPEQEVNVRSLAELRAPVAIRLADCTASQTRRFGVTAAIHSQPDYELTHAWSRALSEAGFGGILYRLSHDPSGSELGVALFGRAGAQDLPVENSSPIPEEVLEEARTRFGLLVLPTPD
jgi:RES domain